MLRFVVALMTGLILVPARPALNRGADGPKLVVNNPGGALRETPVISPLNTTLKSGTYRLVSADGTPTEILAEVIQSGDHSRLAVLLPQVEPGETVYGLAGPIDEAPKPPVEVRKSGKNLDVLVNGKPFTTYAVDLGPKPILYPLLGPKGEHVTRSYPIENKEGEERDHPHHRSFWFTHGKVNDVDFWTEATGHGVIEETSREVVSLGQVGTVIQTRDDWNAADGKKVCEDTRTLRIFATGDARVMDFDLTLTASEGPLQLGDTKEGTFAVRVASSMDAKRKGGGRILNAEGLENTDTWGKRSRWVDYTGPVDGTTAGIAIFDHPESHAHPTPWHVRDYGLFAANPFGFHDFGESKSGDVTLEKGESLSFRYRVVIHSGEVSPSWIEDAYRGYAHPPTITVENP